MDKIQLPIKNFSKQQEIFDSKAMYKIVVKGRRFGLTKGAANDFIKSALERKFKKGLWVDTINANIDKYIERYFMPTLKLLPSNVWNWRKQAGMIEIVDSYIDFRSADKPENIEGFGYDKVFLNEAGIILKDEYLWNNAIRPMLWEYKAPAVVGGTPKGKGLFYELAERGKDKNQPNYELFHFTTFDNPYLDAEHVKKEMIDMPEAVVQQEIYAQFLEDSGVVFKKVSDVCVAIPRKSIDGHLYVIGVDLARVQDYTVLAVYDRSTNEQVYQDRFNKLDWNFQKEKIRTIAKLYNNALCVVDATGLGDPIVDDLLRSGVSVLPFKLTNQSKKEIIEKLSIWIEQRFIKMINLAETVTEFNNFTYDISSSGNIRYNAPVGFHDDIVVAHALAVWESQPIMKARSQSEISRVREEYLRQQTTYGTDAENYEII